MLGARISENSSGSIRREREQIDVEQALKLVLHGETLAETCED